MPDTAGTARTLAPIDVSLPRPHRHPTVGRVVAHLVRQGFPATPDLRQRVRALLPEARRALSMKSLGRVVPIGPGGCVARDALPAEIRRADALGVGLCTVGEDIDAAAAHLRTDGRWIDAWIWDACGIVALAELADRLAREMWGWASARGARASRAYAPGVASSEWDLSHQRLIFRLLPAGRIGVRLTPNLWMHPVKSRSFVVGIGDRVVQAAAPFDCGGCHDATCIHRRAGHRAAAAANRESGGSP